MPLFIVMVIVSFCWPSFTFAALLPPFFLDSVVALGNETLRQSDPRMSKTTHQRPAKRPVHESGRADRTKSPCAESQSNDGME
jgi:hypothetical protein